MKQISAVDWFATRLLLELELTIEDTKTENPKLYEVIQQAKEMGKQQLESCYNHGSFSIIEHGHGETFNEYYTKTFKQ